MQITSIGEVHIQILGGIDYCCHWQMPYLSKNSSINGGEYPHEVGQSIFPLRLLIHLSYRSSRKQSPKIS